MQNPCAYRLVIIRWESIVFAKDLRRRKGNRSVTMVQSWLWCGKCTIHEQSTIMGCAAARHSQHGKKPLSISSLQRVRVENKEECWVLWASGWFPPGLPAACTRRDGEQLGQAEGICKWPKLKLSDLALLLSPWDPRKFFWWEEAGKIALPYFTSLI